MILLLSGVSKHAPIVSLRPDGQHIRSFALVQKKVQKKAKPAGEIKLLPFVPTELVKETMSFFGDARKCKAMLELTFSPQEPADTATDRNEYEAERRKWVNCVTRKVDL